MRGAKLRKVAARLVQAQLAVHRQPDFGSVLVFLAVVLPPADWTQPQCAGRIKSPVSTAWATVANSGSGTHIRFDGNLAATDYETHAAICDLHGLLMSFGPQPLRFPQ